MLNAHLMQAHCIEELDEQLGLWGLWTAFTHKKSGDGPGMKETRTIKKEAELQLLLAEWMLQRSEQLDVVSSIQKNNSEGFSLLLAGLGQMK